MILYILCNTYAALDGIMWWGKMRLQNCNCILSGQEDQSQEINYNLKTLNEEQNKIEAIKILMTNHGLHLGFGFLKHSP